MNLEEASLLVENSLQRLQLDPITARKEKPGMWSLTVKDSPLWIDLFNFPNRPEKYYIQISSSVVSLPEKNLEAFLIDVVELNAEMYHCAMCKKANWFYVLSLRDMDTLMETDMDFIIEKVAYYSADYYSKLSFKYKGSWAPIVPPSDTVV